MANGVRIHATHRFRSKCDSNRQIIAERKIRKNKNISNNLEGRLEKHVLCAKIICNTKAVFRPQDNARVEGKSYRTCQHLCI